MSKKNNIKKAALHLFHKHGYKNVTADMIIQKASVSKGLLFFHFKNMEGLVREIVLDWLVPKWIGLVELNTNGLDISANVEKIFDLARSGLIHNESYYRLFFSIMLSEPQFVRKLQMENSDVFLKMLDRLNQIFKKQTITNIEEEITLLSTTLMGLEMAYCLNSSDERLAQFDTSKKMFLKRYQNMIN